MKRITRTRRLSTEEAAKYNTIREQVAQELPDLIARHESKSAMSADPTEDTRRALVAEINHEPGSREDLESKHGQVWDTDQLTNDFDVKGFMAPVVVVTRKADGVVGSLYFQANPRYYFGFQAD
jgi:hypothetical protein